jgi:hypothetical protein
MFIIVGLSNLNAQVKISWKVDADRKVADIVLYNESNENIIVPLDTTSLQPYYSDSYRITENEWIDRYPFLGLTLNIYDQPDQKNIETQIHSHINLSEFDKIKAENDSIKKEFDIKIKEWKSQNDIQKVNANINYYIINHLVFLHAKEKILFSVPFNLDNITNRKSGPLQGFYLLDCTRNNTGYLSARIDKNIYQYITESQKKKLREYKLFVGELKSNKTEVKCIQNT